MQWIPINVRLPDNRRRVLVWVESCLRRRAHVSRFNASGSGGQFDIEKCGTWFLMGRVTHWCEIEPPAVQR